MQRWLKAPLALPDGTMRARDCGTPQGSAISPVLANLFLHYAFDTWLEHQFPTVDFERYADDVVVHCVTERQALQVRDALAARMAEVALRLHPDKTKVVYCKDDNRRGAYEHTSFVFLGFEFRARSVRNAKSGVTFTAFTPTISPEALKKISREVRSWRIHTRTRHSLQDLADRINPVVRGWMTYYGRFTRAALHPLPKRINGYLVRWARKKYRRLAPFVSAGSTTVPPAVAVPASRLRRRPGAHPRPRTDRAGASARWAPVRRHDHHDDARRRLRRTLTSRVPTRWRTTSPGR